MSIYNQWMSRALELANRAYKDNEVPVGALILYNNEIIAEGYNQRETKPSALAHAEILAIEEASQKLDRWRLSDCVLITTLEPCVMCAGAIIQSRISKLVYGATDPKGGAHSLYQLFNDQKLNHRVEIESGILEDECSKLLKKFFQEKRLK